ncbi:Isoleucine--tRNA ligase [Hibiscus syriacus]|uniref:isoleucine--tRNA ligase n=1 Tax=Hibiscus syriacus TaxID=106335 RepID=A0A6A3CNN8_HIBSY|nr:Isoleucine--tRNA ligase [Hibiscus syriacus]
MNIVHSSSETLDFFENSLKLSLPLAFILSLLQSLDQDARKDLTPLKLRAKAAKFAKATVKAQMSSFQRFGVWADWDNPYLTLDPKYEAAQIEVFGEMALRGYIYRGRKPVHWSPSSRTALAEAELEYPEGHVSRSIYVLFRMVSAPASKDSLLKEFFPDLCFAIWTTTPWTVPANAAVAVNAKLQYAVVGAKPFFEDAHLSAGNKKKRVGNVLKEPNMPFFIVAYDLVPTLEAKWGIKLIIKKTLLGSDLENFRYVHPVTNIECPVVIGGDYITTESGTGLVHTAPGHGQEDYVTGMKYGLPINSPVDDDGKFTDEAGQFNGLDVLGDGNVAVVKYLDEKMSLIMEESYEHKYPYDWRTKKPTIFRATEQWFASVEGFHQAVMDAIGHVKWIPAQRAVVLVLYKERCISLGNARVFEGTPIDKVSLFFIIRFRIAKWFLAKFPGITIQEDVLIGNPSLADGVSSSNVIDRVVLRWLPPPVDFLKMNVDGAVRQIDSGGGIGGLLRDWNGCTLLTFSESIGQAIPPLAELKAIKRGLDIFLSSRWASVARLIVESDCSSAVEWIHSPVLAPIFFLPIVFQISRLISDKVHSFRLIPRECNGEADILAKEGIG